MDRAYDILRTGAWLTRERTRLIASGVLLASVIGLTFLVLTANGLLDTLGRPLGTDFSSFYAAGTYVLDGRPAAPYDLAQHYAREQSIFGPATPFYGWLYPPFFLFVAGALALMPYGLALFVWQALTLALYLLTIRAIASRPLGTTAGPHSTIDPMWLLLALAFPAVIINVGHGQNGFLTAALLGGALATLESRPLVAGILFGLLAYKPQFAVMIPIALAASGRWRCLATAAATVAGLAIVTTCILGLPVWQAFLASTHFTRVSVLEQGDPGWYKMQSLFAWARMWGAPLPLAYALQAMLDASLAAALTVLWRGATPYPLKAAALCLAVILATPFTFDYDMTVLAPAVAFFVVDGLDRGFGPWEKTALATLWIMPFIARSIALATLVPLGVPIMLAVFILILRRSGILFAPPTAFAGRFFLK